MGTNNYPESADMVIRDLRQRIERLEAAAQTRVAQDTITGGALQVQDAAGNTYVYIGQVGPAWPDGSPQYGIEFSRQTGPQQVGQVALALWNRVPGTFTETLEMYDGSGNMTYGDDGESGFGLARPYVSFPMSRADNQNWPTTTLATFTDMLFSFPPVQHPKVVVSGWSFAPTGTTYQLQLVSNGNVLAGPASFTGNTSTLAAWSFGPVAWPAGTAYLAATDLRVQACRTAGTGNVQIALGNAYGCQS